MAIDNPLWGEERIANELLLKLGIRVSPRTVGKYMPKRPPGKPRGDQRWATFLRNHAQAIIACDFFVAVTATFRLFYVFVLIHHGSRRMVHFNVTAHPTAAWTLQQLRDAIGFEHGYRYLIHDRDSIFAKSLDDSLRGFGLRTLKSPPHSPMANAVCERLIGTIRRECYKRRPQTFDGDTGMLDPTPRRIDLSSLRDIRLELAYLYRQIDAGKIPSQDGTRRAYVLRQIADVLTITEIERRLDELEERNARRLLPSNQFQVRMN
jgi:transposase InsO family protein